MNLSNSRDAILRVLSLNTFLVLNNFGLTKWSVNSNCNIASFCYYINITSSYSQKLINVIILRHFDLAGLLWSSCIHRNLRFLGTFVEELHPYSQIQQQLSQTCQFSVGKPMNIEDHWLTCRLRVLCNVNSSNCWIACLICRISNIWSSD